MRSLLVIVLCSVAFAAHPKWDPINNGEDAESIQIKIPKPKEFLKDKEKNDDAKKLQPGQYLTDRSLVHQPGKIVGGSLVGIQSYPSLVSLQYIEGNGGFFHSCGGSILSTTRVLTAAHCQPPVLLLSTLRARAGSTDNQIGGQLRSVIVWNSHPLYARDILDYDIAILTLDSPFTYTDVIQPVRLASGPEANDNSIVHVAGWGTIYEGTGSERYLRHVNLPVVNRERCRDTYSFLTARQICYGGTQFGSQSACQGDSGGPAFQNGFQYGIVSGGYSCHTPYIPGVYANVPQLFSWIQENSS